MRMTYLHLTSFRSTQRAPLSRYLEAALYRYSIALHSTSSSMISSFGSRPPHPSLLMYTPHLITLHWTSSSMISSFGTTLPIHLCRCTHPNDMLRFFFLLNLQGYITATGWGTSCCIQPNRRKFNLNILDLGKYIFYFSVSCISTLWCRTSVICASEYMGPILQDCLQQL